MPMLVNKLIFHIIPERSPFFIRPILKAAFNQVAAKMIDPRLKIHAEMVSVKKYSRLQVTNIHLVD